MEENFFELPLDREMYKSKKFERKSKPPLRVLLTEAGGKIAYNVIYQICSGNVFGPNQEIILHLISTRGPTHHGALIMEIEECGFPLLKDFVVSADPRLAYKKVDLVIVMATFEEIPGRPFSDAMVYQLINARKVAQCVQDYGNKGSKIIFAGPSAKGLSLVLTVFHRFAPGIPTGSVSAVTHMDVVISKNILAAKLKTTTDKIKNIIVWGATHPDIQNATIRMYPPGDIGKWEMKDIPVAEVLEDMDWARSTFMKDIFRKILHPDIVKYGKSVAQGIVQHLQYLYFGSKAFDEMPSMMCSALYNGYEYGLSYPMITENLTWKINKDVACSVATQLYILRTIFHLTEGNTNSSANNIIEFLKECDLSKTPMGILYNKHIAETLFSQKDWFVKYFVTQSPGEWVTKIHKTKSMNQKKSIVWDDELAIERPKLLPDKSLIRFSSGNIEVPRKEIKIAPTA